MAVTKNKGDLGEAMVMADALRRGHKVAIPFGEDWPYDLIVLREGRLERVQCKYVESRDGKIIVPCRSCNNWRTKKYGKDDVDWIACYDKTTDTCYYISSDILGDGRNCIVLRVGNGKGKQAANKTIRRAEDYLMF